MNLMSERLKRLTAVFTVVCFLGLVVAPCLVTAPAAYAEEKEEKAKNEEAKEKGMGEKLVEVGEVGGKSLVTEYVGRKLGIVVPYGWLLPAAEAGGKLFGIDEVGDTLKYVDPFYWLGQLGHLIFGGGNDIEIPDKVKEAFEEKCEDYKKRTGKDYLASVLEECETHGNPLNKQKEGLDYEDQKALDKELEATNLTPQEMDRKLKEIHAAKEKTPQSQQGLTIPLRDRNTIKELHHHDVKTRGPKFIPDPKQKNN